MNEERCHWNDLYQELLTEGIDPAEIERQKARLLARGVNPFKLIEIRIRCGLSQKDVAAAMGVATETVGRIESGELSSIEMLGPYAAALGGRLRVLVDFGDDMIAING